MPRWETHQTRRPMKVITINLAQHYLDVLDFIVQKGITPSRSEAVRLALSYGLPKLERMILRQERLVRRTKTSKTIHTPSNKIFVENGDGTFQQYTIVGEA